MTKKTKTAEETATDVAVEPALVEIELSVPLNNVEGNGLIKTYVGKVSVDAETAKDLKRREAEYKTYQANLIMERKDNVNIGEYGG